MDPYCSKCFTKDTEPVEADSGELIYWFKIQEESETEDEEYGTIGIDEYGEVEYIFIGISEKDFEYDESYKLVCPDCMVEELNESDEFEEF